MRKRMHRSRRRRLAARLALAVACALAAAPAPLQACVDGRTLAFGFYDDFEPVSYSAAKGPERGGRDEHRGYEADLLTAVEAMGGVSFARRAIGVWPGLWLRAAGPEYDVIGGGVTIRGDRTRDAAGRTAVAFTAGHVAFVQTLLVRAGDAARFGSYSGLTGSARVAALPGTTGEERLLQLTGYVDPAGALRRGTRIHLAGGQVLEADGTDHYTITAAEASANLAERRRLEPPAGAGGLPQVVYFTDEDAQLGSLRAGTADAVARGLIGNADAAARSGGALVIAARDARVEYGGFAVAVEDDALRACLDERIDYLTDSLLIGYEEWRADPEVFLRRAERRAGAGGEDSNRAGAARRSILPELARALPAETFAAVEQRVESAFSGTPGGAASAANLQRLAGAAATGRLDGAAFALPLRSSDGGASAALWGAGAHRSVSGGGAGAPQWDGGVTTGWLGADARLGRSALAGLAVSFARGAFDFAGGDYDMRMTSAHPYAGWKPLDETLLWASAGYGRGEAEIGGAADGRRLASDLELSAAAFGGAARLLARPADGADGATELALKGEAWTARLESGGAEGVAEDALPALAANAHRVRTALALRFRRPAPGGGQLASSLEAGALYDGGDGMSGAGADLAAALHWSDPDAGLAVEARGRWLAAHRSQPREWSAGGGIAFDPGARGRGLSFALAPSFAGAATGLPQKRASGARLNARLAWGARALGGLLTPWSAVTLAGGGAPEYRLGARLAFAARRIVTVEARRRSGEDGPESELVLHGAARF